MIFAMGYRGHEIIEERVSNYAIDCDLKHGYMDVALKPRQVHEHQQWYEELDKRGFANKIRLVGRDEMRDVLGTDAYLGGLINNRNAHLHPLNLCLGEARAAAEMGASIFENTEVLDIVHGRRPVVVTAQGRIEAEAVVLAGNAYHHLEQHKLGGKLFPAGSYIIATEALTEAEAREINPLDLAVCDQKTVLDYYRLSTDRRMLFGGRCNYSGREPKSIKASMLPRMVKVFPQLANKRIDFEWGGNIGIVLNRVPMIGRVSSNVFYSVGYSGHGVSASHLAGEIMADAVDGRLDRLELFEKIQHQRIPFGQRFGSQLLALGMLYYRLWDT